MSDLLYIVGFIFGFYLLERIVESGRTPMEQDACNRFLRDLKRQVAYPPDRWEVFENERGDRSVVPVGENHVHDSGCACGPKVEVVGANVVIVHNAFDHREIVEQAIEIMNGNGVE